MLMLRRLGASTCSGGLPLAAATGLRPTTLALARGGMVARAIGGIRAQAEDMDVDPGPFRNFYKDYVPPVRQRVVDETTRSYGTGKRKTAIARVWVKEGSGQFVVNHMPLHQYIRKYVRWEILQVMLSTKIAGLLDVYCTVKGGGSDRLFREDVVDLRFVRYFFASVCDQTRACKSYPSIRSGFQTAYEKR
jgi:hypothetical protein